MNILVPLPDLIDSSRVFKDNNLFNQVYNISYALDALHLVSRQYLRVNPFVQMWQGFEVVLCEYGLTLAEEYSRRDDSVRVDSYKEQIMWHMENATSGSFSMDKPSWWGDMRVHLGHQALLLAFDKEYYSQFFDVSESTQLYFPTV